MTEATNRSSVEVRLDVPYGGGPSGTLCNDLYLPKTPGPHPALLCLHGGAWLRGSQRHYQSWGPWLAERGHAVVAVDYRLSSQISPAWPGVLEDVCRAFRWLMAQAPTLNIDTKRLGLSAIRPAPTWLGCCRLKNQLRRMCELWSGCTGFMTCQIGGESRSLPSGLTIRCACLWENLGWKRKKNTKASLRYTASKPSNLVR